MKKEIKDDASQQTGIKASGNYCQGGYGYMKRRLGLLSFEADKAKKEKNSASKK